MNTNTKHGIAIRTLTDLLDEAAEQGESTTYLNDDDFADAAEIILIGDKIDFELDDLSEIARLIELLCDRFGIRH
jgi:hypothetical protein